MYCWLRLNKRGSGKTSTVRVIISALGLAPWEVVYVTYTGKAAQVLAQKGCPNAKTLHKLLYRSSFNEKTGKYTNSPRMRLEHNYKLIVVDEISMVPQYLWELLLSHHIPVIALGDPG